MPWILGDDILLGPQNLSPDAWPDGSDGLRGALATIASGSSPHGSPSRAGKGATLSGRSGDVLISGAPGSDSIEAFAGSAIIAGEGQQDVIAPRWLALILGAPGAPDALILGTDFDPGASGGRLDVARLLREGVSDHTGGSLVEAGTLRLRQDAAHQEIALVAREDCGRGNTRPTARV